MMMDRPASLPPRRLPVGAEVLPQGGVHFRVWAPLRQQVAVAMRAAPGSDPWRLELTAESGGYLSGHCPRAASGTRYGFCLDGSDRPYPDPASRSQPQGVHELSEVVDPAAYRWSDSGWTGYKLPRQVVYELHVGTFTQEGTWQAAIDKLPRLAELGVTLLELMPVAEFAGEFGWGYDGVDLFAPTRLYGTPDDMRRFVDAAHQARLGVILDVVYNHFGPTGNYLGQYSADYLSNKHHTDWGDAVNFDGANAAPVREFIAANAGYWIDEFHIDGLRLDAVHAIVDDSPDHILAALTRQVRAKAAGRETLIFVENELQQGCVLRACDVQGYGLDAGWNDDFHHTARVAAAGHGEFYFGDYQGTPQELLSATKWGHLYQGQFNARQQRQRGTSALGLPAQQFVNFLENHDQVGNSPQGRRFHELTSPGRYRALTALLLLAPGTPLLFQGQEYGATTPFHYFADHEPELARLVKEGRYNQLRAFLRVAGGDAAAHFADPCDRGTFLASKLDDDEQARNSAAYALHYDLLKLRREDPVFAAQRADRLHGAVIGPEALMLRYLGEQGDDRLLIVNLGRDLEWRPLAEPLAAAPDGTSWQAVWSSENPKYGGSGTREFDWQNWYIQGHAALVLRAAASP